MFRKLCGDSTLKNVVLVTNMWSEVTPEVGEDREKELSGNFFKPVLDLGAQLARHHNTLESAHGIVWRIMANDPLVLQIQKEIVEDGKDIINTAAGEAVNEELAEQMRQHEAKLKEVREEMRQALEENDERAKQELEKERGKLQALVDKVKKDSDGLASNFAAERKKWEGKVKEMERVAKEERERLAVEHKQQLANLNRKLEDAKHASTAEQEKLKEELKKLQRRVGTSARIPIYKCVFEPQTFSFYFETPLINFLGPPIPRTCLITLEIIHLATLCRRCGKIS